MYEQYRADPESVGESWREFFEDYRSMTAAAHPELAPPAAQPAPAEIGTGRAGAVTPAPATPAQRPAPADLRGRSPRRPRVGGRLAEPAS